MYHGILSASAALPPAWDPRYTTAEEAFSAQLDLIVAKGWRTALPSQVEKAKLAERSVLITFDDGHLSDLLIAAPSLRRRGLAASFFVTWSHLGRPGFLDHRQLQTLHEFGFRIGSHSMSHAMLSELGKTAMRDEIVRSKQELENLLGVEIAELAIPGGRYDRRVLHEAFNAGYRSILTSDFALATAGKRVLPRMAILSSTVLEEFQAMLEGELAYLVRRRLISKLTRSLRRFVGVDRFNKLRSLTVGRRGS